MADAAGQVTALVPVVASVGVLNAVSKSTMGKSSGKSSGLSMKWPK